MVLKELAKLQKVFHDSEKKWVSCDSKETRREKRRACGEEKEV